jgi:hypothetical protein
LVYSSSKEKADKFSARLCHNCNEGLLLVHGARSGDDFVFDAELAGLELLEFERID